MDNEPTLRFRWNDHVPHLSKVFSEQRIDEQYCNTSLVTDDGYIIKVHSIILTMTSGYFERILRNVCQDQHPIIVLNGVNYKELICVIDYIYQGLTRVDERLMASVLDLADILEIKGLSKMKNNISVKKLIAPSNPHSSILPHFHCNSKIISSISSLSQNSVNHTLKIDSEDKNCNSLEKERREYEALHERNNLCMKDIKERHHQSSENLENLNEEVEESMDQTSGIDLSLSKSVPSVVINKDNGKSFSFYDESSLRKRKINSENSENFQNIANDMDFGKIGDKVEIEAFYKQKKHFGKSADDEERNTFCGRRSYSAPLFSKHCGSMIGKVIPGSLTPSATDGEEKNFDYFSFSDRDDICMDINCNQSTLGAGGSNYLSRRSWSPAEDMLYTTFANKEDIPYRVNEIFVNGENKNFQSLDLSSDEHDHINNAHISKIRNASSEIKCDNQESVNRRYETAESSSQTYIESDYCMDSFRSPCRAEDKSSTANKYANRENYFGSFNSACLENATVRANTTKSIPFSLSSSNPGSNITICYVNKDASRVVQRVVDTDSNDTRNISAITSVPKMFHLTSTTDATKINLVPCNTLQTSRNGCEVVRGSHPPSNVLPELIKVHVNKLTQGQSHLSSDKVREIFEILNCKKPKSQVKRPLNMFNLYVKSMLPSISSQYTIQQKISLISQMWNDLSSDEKLKWAEKAKQMKSEFFRRNPGFEFSYEKIRFQEEEYKQKKHAKQYLFLPNSSK